MTAGAHAYRRTVERRAMDSMKANKTKKGTKKEKKRENVYRGDKFAPLVAYLLLRQVWRANRTRAEVSDRQGLKSVIDKEGDAGGGGI